jgi:hypothetical protein
VSAGSGRVERAIEVAFVANPDEIFTTDDLHKIVYGNQEGPLIKKKHVMIILHAANKVRARLSDWHIWRSENRGVIIFFNHASVTSYALAKKRRADFSRHSETRIRRDLAPGGRDHHLIVEGGAWWRYVQLYIAKRNRDIEREKILMAQVNTVTEQHRAESRSAPPDVSLEPE